MHRILMLVSIALSALACSQEHSAPSAAGTRSAWQQIQIDGVSYRQVAAKANAAQASDVSIELSYDIRGGQAYISAVRIDGVQYRADCSGVEPPQQQESDLPHYEFCEEGVGQRDVDFTCSGYRGALDPTPSPFWIRMPAEDVNITHLLKQFETATMLIMPDPSEAAWESNTFNLTDGEDDFFRFDVGQQSRCLIASDGDSDTWGDLYRIDGNSVVEIAGTGRFGSRNNFQFDMTLDQGAYLLRVSAENANAEGRFVAGSYTIILKSF